jgi:hypothetical protein
MKNKKGSHVGVILSFVIFVTFLVFLFSIFGSPIKLPSNKDALIDHIEIEFKNKFSSNLIILTISPNMSEVDNSCIEINNSYLELEEVNSLVKDKGNIIIGSNPNQGPNLYIDWSNNQEFFKIFYSEEDLDNLEFSEGDDCYELVSADIKTFRENKYFNINKTNEFFSQYESNYSKLKSDFNFPMNNDFSLSFVDSEKNIINETEQRDIITDIYSREIPVQYFNESANINSGFINIKVW